MAWLLGLVSTLSSLGRGGVTIARGFVGIDAEGGDIGTVIPEEGISGTANDGGTSGTALALGGDGPSATRILDTGTWRNEAIFKDASCTDGFA